MENINNKNLMDEVIKKIETGEVKMRPKTFFIAKIAVTIILTLLVLLISVISTCYLVFSIKTEGLFYLLGFGTKGFLKFFLVLPWIFLIINTFLIILLDLLLKRFKFGYHNPLLYLFVVTLSVVAVLSYVVNYTGFHKYAINSPIKDPVLNLKKYHELGKSHRDRGYIRGNVVSIGDNFITIRHGNRDFEPGKIEVVYIDNAKNLYSFIGVGDEIFVAGEIASGTVMSAYGVRKFDY